MPGLKAGRLRHRMLLQERVRGQDPDTLEPIFTWVDVATVWGAFEPLSARDFIAAQAEQSEVRARIVIRFRDGMHAQMRFVLHGKAHQVVGALADMDSNREYLTLPVTEGVRVV